MSALFDKTDRDDVASVPFRCQRCGGNNWRVFEGDAARESGHVYVRLRCANPRCPHGNHVVVRRWLGEAMGGPT